MSMPELDMPLVELQDGAILNIITDEESYDGCDTCDYGSRYINNIEVVFSHHSLKIKVDKMYEFAISSNHLIKLFLQNLDMIKSMTEEECEKWIAAHFRKMMNESPSYDHMKVEFN